MNTDLEITLAAPAPVKAPEPASDQAAAGRTLPGTREYEVLSFIGRGAYGDVWLARDTQGQTWAVKAVYRMSFDDDRPYEREYRGIIKFQPISVLSPSQLQVQYIGRRDDAGYFFYIMEAADDINNGRRIDPAAYVPRTLKSDLQRQPRLPVSECLSIAQDLAVALENLHAHGLVHRDIKPANIIFVNGRPKLADVGLVTHPKATLSCAGTIGYIPPEGPGSFSADIYSFGKVLYEMSTGQSCLDFPILPQDLEALPDQQGILELNKIVTRACQADARRRYTQLRDLRRDLDYLLRGKSLRRRASLERVTLAGLATIAAALSFAGTVWSLRHWHFF